MPTFSIEVSTCPKTQSSNRKDAIQSALQHGNGIHLEWALAVQGHTWGTATPINIGIRPEGQGCGKGHRSLTRHAPDHWPIQWTPPVRLRNHRQTKNHHITANLHEQTAKNSRCVTTTRDHSVANHQWFNANNELPAVTMVDSS